VRWTLSVAVAERTRDSDFLAATDEKAVRLILQRQDLPAELPNDFTESTKFPLLSGIALCADRVAVFDLTEDFLWFADMPAMEAAEISFV
jgi:hypothetical protein